LSAFPETRDSLLVQDPANRDAWELFARIYRPVIVRIVLAHDLQHADAQDLSQQVLMAVSAGAVRPRTAEMRLASPERPTQSQMCRPAGPWGVT
jgi:hypothetical protein